MLKVLSVKGAADPDLLEVFERAAKLLANLRHPRIPKYLDYFTEEGEHGVYLVLVQEHVGGVDLGPLIADGKRFHEKEVIAIGQQIAEVLEYLHDFSPPVVHRDVKPSNIVLTKSGHAYLVDFAAAKDQIQADEPVPATSETASLGYAPTEQLQGASVPETCCCA